jgi:hypothetical protein
MKNFVIWFESLSWQPALCFAVAVGILLCVLIILADIGIRKFLIWRERQQIKECKWQEKKRRLIEDLERQGRQPRRAPRIPRTMRDFKVRP